MGKITRKLYISLVFAGDEKLLEIITQNYANAGGECFSIVMIPLDCLFNSPMRRLLISSHDKRLRYFAFSN